MALHRFGKSNILIQIENDDFDLFVIGDNSINKLGLLNINLNHPAVLNVEDYYYTNSIIRTINSNGCLVQNSSNTMLPCFYEDGKYQIVLETKNNNKFKIIHSKIDITKDFQQIGKNYIGIIDFASDIGYTNIEVFKGSKKVLGLTIEVFPSKIDYFKDYKELIMEINEEISALAFKLLDKTYLIGELKDTEHQTNAEFLNILDIIFNRLELALKRIVNNFKHSVITCEKITSLHKTKLISKRSKRYIRTHADILIKSDKGILSINGGLYYPEKVVEEKKITTIDIFENRFVKYMVQKIIKRLRSIETYLDCKDERENQVLDFAKKKTMTMEKYLNDYFFRVGELTGHKSMSLVFQMAPGYKEMYKQYITLNKGLDLGNDLFKITPKKIYSLYEIWCYIKIHKILTELGYEVEKYDVLQYKDNGITFSLLQNSQTKMIYKGPKNKLELWYNKSYSPPTTDQRPDTVLHIRNLSGDKKRTYIFDAKYRIAIDNDGVVGPEVEDINVMHRYRDAIVSEITSDFQYKYETFGAYVMFPYGDEESFREHKFYKSIDKVNIGGFPMLPGSTKLLTRHLEKLTNQSAIEAKSDRLVMDEYDDYARFKLENVMVVNVKDRLHLNKYIENRFYHIPAKRLSNIRLGVEYLAFYQSKRIFGEEGGIRYFSRIKDVVNYQREECFEIPAGKGNEKEIYLRFNLSDIREISCVEPIQSGTQLISYTTLYLLQNAVNMHELKLSSNFEVEVYKKIKRVAKDYNWSIRKKHNKYIAGNNSIEILDNKRIRVNGKIINLRNFEKILMH